MILIAALILAAFAQEPTPTAAPQVPTVRYSIGRILRAKGEIHWSRPEAGAEVATADDKNTDRTHPAPFTIAYITPEQDREFRKPVEQVRKSRGLKKMVLDPLSFGEILRLDPNSKLELILPDKTLLEADPGAHFELSSLTGSGPKRKLLLRFLSGKFHVHISETITAPGEAVFETPNAVLRHRKQDARFGDEFFVDVTFDSERVGSTTVKMIHGSLSADSIKILKGGKTFLDTQVIEPARVVTIKGRHGLNELH